MRTVTPRTVRDLTSAGVHLVSGGRKSQQLAFCEQAEVFEEIPTMEFPFHGIPTIPPRKDMDHMVSPTNVMRQMLGYMQPVVLPQSLFC